MSRGPIRRAQLVAPFGTGAITVVPDGTALLTAGLDYWYQREDGSSSPDDIDVEEFRIEEWRLQEALRVSHFRLPPDFRVKRFGEKQIKNLRLTVPFLRFPRWNFCPRCKRLDVLPLSFKSRKRCDECEQRHQAGGGKGWRPPYIAQVPFIAICEKGHLQDFPWREWVHRSLAPPCSDPMRLRSTGGASLSAQSVECDCGKKRNLAQITDAAPVGSSEYPRTYLTSNLAPEGPYVCRGAEPWNGNDEGRGCGLPVRGSLRAASNVYYARVKSSIYLPRGGGDVPAKLLEILTNPPLSTVVHTIRSLSLDPTPEQLRNSPDGNLLKPFSDDQVKRGIASTGFLSAPPESEEDGADEEPGDETEFRRPEFEALRVEQDAPELQVSTRPKAEYGLGAGEVFARVMLVERLRETRSLWGFSRIYPEGGGLRECRALLWKDQPSWPHSWLPAYVVHGEGIFLELDETRLAQWESKASVRGRVETARHRYEIVRGARGLRERVITPRFVLLHTLAHLLINQLTFECGYSSAALRERLYLASGSHPMAAILIYTAAGDAEGTMGGLVRMGKPGYFEHTLREALHGARWCSADPVCMEIGEAGQGPDSTNMAACHNCALVPETACEEFNRFLDRGLLIGTHRDPDLGFFGSAF